MSQPVRDWANECGWSVGVALRAVGRDMVVVREIAVEMGNRGCSIPSILCILLDGLHVANAKRQLVGARYR